MWSKLRRLLPFRHGFKENVHRIQSRLTSYEIISFIMALYGATSAKYGHLKHVIIGQIDIIFIESSEWSRTLVPCFGAFIRPRRIVRNTGPIRNNGYMVTLQLHLLITAKKVSRKQEKKNRPWFNGQLWQCAIRQRCRPFHPLPLIIVIYICQTNGHNKTFPPESETYAQKTWHLFLHNAAISTGLWVMSMILYAAHTTG